MRYIIAFYFFCLVTQLDAQLLNSSQENVTINALSPQLKTPSQITIPQESKLKSDQPIEIIAKVFGIPQDELSFRNETKVAPGISVKRYMRTINDVRVAHGFYTILYKEDKALSIHAEHYPKNNIRNKIALSEDDALATALPKLGSEMFAWESTQQLIKSNTTNKRRKEALQRALEQDFPKGELVYVRDYFSESHDLEIAYLFTIESVVPEFRDRVYVSAIDGRILLRDPQQKHGVGDTRYSGTRSFPTTEITGPPGAIYELKGTESFSGVYCETRSLEGLGGLPVSSPAIAALSDSIADGDEPDPCLTDGSDTVVEFGDDEWDSNEHRKVPFSPIGGSCCLAYVSGVCDEVRNDDIALDAHWGASMVARYWKDIHNRFGYDDNGASINSYVHHGLSHENASWNGMIMKYGDGAYQDGSNPGGMFGPLVSLDVCAHEIGHAICTSTSDLVYVGESGAINEGLSDIWAATIESYVLDSIDGSLDYVVWSIGEQCDERDGGLYDEPGARALRWMDHPPAENNPDTYGAGTWWQDPECASPNAANDWCGVHFNSGVLNKWFYLLTEGSGLALSPGLNKPAFDDEINDKGNTYSVNGIGIRKTEKIVYGANLLLLPNSKFADMRAASIDIARSLYGPCSNEVEQTIRAWYAVGVGPDFGSCLPTIEFNQFNPYLISESSDSVGCSVSKEINLSFFSYMSTATVNFTTSGNAIEGEDFELCVNSIDVNGDEEKQLKILIFDDEIIEGNDTLIVTLNGGGFTDSDTIIITNDDGIPALVGLDSLLIETFDVNDNSWKQELVNPTSLLNEWYIDAFNTNQAHISYPPTMNLVSYFQLIESHVRLKSPQIDALGYKNINVSFNYQVGGERDLVDTSAIFDYGTFEISYDGFEWEEIDLFVGTAASGGMIPDSGLYQITLNQLDNSTFYLGYTWHNDALNGSAYSFMFDNVLVTGEGLEIESEVGDYMETDVPEQETIPFITPEDLEIIAMIETSTSNLGCTNISVFANDALTDTMASTCKFRSSKLFKMTTENASDSILMTVYFTPEEVDDWSDYLNLNIITFNSDDVENEQSIESIIDNADITVDDQVINGEGYVAFTFWTTSNSTVFGLTNRPSVPEVHTVLNILDVDPFSFRGLVEKACPNDTITFISDINGQTIHLISGAVAIPIKLNIIGNGIANTILNGPTTNALYITSTGSVSLESLSINSPSPTTILNEGNVLISDNVGIGN